MSFTKKMLKKGLLKSFTHAPLYITVDIGMISEMEIYYKIILREKKNNCNIC